VVLMMGTFLLEQWPVKAPKAQAANLSPNFPRIASIDSKTSEETDSVQHLIARNALYITDPLNWPATDSNSTSQTIGQYLKSLNPSLIALIYFHSVLQPDLSWEYYPGVWNVNGTQYYFDPRWYMTYDGSALSSAVDASATVIPVRDLSKFTVGDRVMLGGVANQSRVELATVSAMSGSNGAGNLTVSRGTFSQGGKFGPIAHNAGDWVRTVAHTFGNPAWLVLNPTSNCLVSDANPSFGSQTWDQFLGAFLKLKLGGSAFTNLDGVFLDNFADNASFVDLSVRVDANNANQASGLSDSTWSAGMKNLAASVQGALPSTWAVLANTGGQHPSNFGQNLSGGLIEGIDQNGHSMQGATQDALNYYNSWMASARAPQTFIMDGSPHVSGLSAGQSSYQAMRFSLTLTLTNNGYFAFDEVNVTGGHQTVWWYDEYDNAGKGTGYLGQPSGAATQPVGGVYRRDFANGLSLSNTPSSAQTITLGGTFQKIKGTQAPTVNDGSLVTSVTLQPNDGIILLRTSAPTVTPTATVSATATPSASASATSTSVPTITATSTPSRSAAATSVPTMTPTPSSPQKQVAPAKTPTSTSFGGPSSGVPQAPPPASSPAAQAPAPPSNLSASVQPGQDRLSWKGTSAANATYNVYRQGGLYRSGISGTSFNDAGVSVGVYLYQVSAVIGGKESALSNMAVAVQQPALAR
jgi:hypothetical protein